MRSERIKSCFLSIIMVLLFCINAEAQDSPAAATAFLRLGMDARGSALGGSLAASGAGLHTVHWNPAGLAGSSTHEIAFSHMSGLNDIDTEYLGFLYNLNNERTVGLSFLSNNIGEIEFRTRPTANPEAIISSHDFFAGLTYAMVYNEHIKLGITGKLLYQKIFEYSATGFSGDFGVTYDATEAYNVTLGAALMNIGSLGALKNEKAEMPALARFGAAHKLSFLRDSPHSVSISADYEIIFTGDNHFLVGSEYTYQEKYSLRGGFLTGYEERSFSLGAGLGFSNYVLDYAYLPDITSFGDNHLITVRVKL